MTPTFTAYLAGALVETFNSRYPGITLTLSTLQKQFACARLSRSCLPGSSPRRFRDANDRGI
jgi:hypothetical protein